MDISEKNNNVMYSTKRQTLIREIEEGRLNPIDIPDEFCDDKDVIFALVNKYGFDGLVFATEDLQYDHEIVQQARNAQRRMEAREKTTEKKESSLVIEKEWAIEGIKSGRIDSLLLIYSLRPELLEDRSVIAKWVQIHGSKDWNLIGATLKTDKGIKMMASFADGMNKNQKYRNGLANKVNDTRIDVDETLDDSDLLDEADELEEELEMNYGDETLDDSDLLDEADELEEELEMNYGDETLDDSDLLDEANELEEEGVNEQASEREQAEQQLRAAIMENAQLGGNILKVQQLMHEFREQMGRVNQVERSEGRI